MRVFLLGPRVFPFVRENERVSHRVLLVYESLLLTHCSSVCLNSMPLNRRSRSFFLFLCLSVCLSLSPLDLSPFQTGGQQRCRLCYHRETLNFETLISEKQSFLRFVTAGLSSFTIDLSQWQTGNKRNMSRVFCPADFSSVPSSLL